MQAAAQAAVQAGVQAPVGAYDAVVIGGGVAGCGVAYHLAARGARVAVVERGGLGDGTSSATHCNLSLHNRLPGPDFALAMASVSTYERFVADLGWELGYQRRGSVLLVEREEDLPEVARRAAAQTAAGLRVEFLDGPALRRADPATAADLAGGALCRRSAWFDPGSLLRSYARAVRAAKGRVLTHTEATGIVVSRNRAVGVVTRAGRLTAGAVVVAAGAWAAGVAKMAGSRLTIIPERGQVLVTERMPALGAGIRTEFRRGHGPGFWLVLTQTESGNFLIGRCGDPAGWDRSVVPAAMAAVAARAARFVPALGRAAVIRAFAGLRPYSADGLPLLGPADGPVGLYVAAGLGDKGIGIGYGSALVAEMIAGEKTSLDATAFDPRRSTALGAAGTRPPQGGAGGEIE